MNLYLRNAFLTFRSSFRCFRMASTGTPGCKLSWKISVEEIPKRTEVLINEAKKLHDEIGCLQKQEISISSVLEPLSAHDALYSIERNMLDFLQHVSPDKKIREASTEADKALSSFEVDLSMRKDIFDVFVSLEKTINKCVVDAESQRYIERTIKEGKRKGLHLDDNIQEQLKKNLKRASELSIDFQRNLGEDTSATYFSKEELDGIDEDFINSLEKNDEGKYKVTCQYPHYFPVQKKCRVPETRRQLELAFNSRCQDSNSVILKELTALRAQKAALLGFPNHADFKLDMEMAKNSGNVAEFLSSLEGKLRVLKDKELKQFRELKKVEEGGDDVMMHSWDMRFYMNLVEERRYKVDHLTLKQYFPLDVVMKGLLDIYQELLSLKFTEISEPDVWHEDVLMYSVVCTLTNDLIGYFYLDLHPREGKFGHAACFGLQPRYYKSDKDKLVAVAAMVANFSRPQSGKPALLLHNEVIVFFHEFGHVMHHICANPRHAYFAGTNVETDFVEAPSQMLENWCWEEESLRRMSGHYESGAPIPGDLLSKLVASKQANAGLFNTRQILLASFDQSIHASGGDKLDPNEEYFRLSDEIMGIAATPGTNVPATFGHIAGGYDAKYYGYLWSEVFSVDMFVARFKSSGILNPETGASYRKCILQPGGSRDAADMLRDFLGRDPNQDAFLKSKGLDVN